MCKKFASDAVPLCAPSLSKDPVTTLCAVLAGDRPCVAVGRKGAGTAIVSLRGPVGSQLSKFSAPKKTDSDVKIVDAAGPNAVSPSIPSESSSLEVEVLFVVPGSKAATACSAPAASGSVFAVGHGNGSIAVVGLKAGRQVPSVTWVQRPHARPVVSLAWSPCTGAVGKGSMAIAAVAANGKWSAHGVSFGDAGEVECVYSIFL